MKNQVDVEIQRRSDNLNSGHLMSFDPTNINVAGGPEGKEKTRKQTSRRCDKV